MAFQVGLLAVCLLILYVLVVLAAILPPRLLDPAWQLRFTNALINNGFLALLGLTLIHRAALALAAVLGFLLLIPLQGMRSSAASATPTASRAASCVR